MFKTEIEKFVNSEFNTEKLKELLSSLKEVLSEQREVQDILLDDIERGLSLYKEGLENNFNPEVMKAIEKMIKNYLIILGQIVC